VVRSVVTTRKTMMTTSFIKIGHDNDEGDAECEVRSVTTNKMVRTMSTTLTVNVVYDGRDNGDGGVR